MGKHCDKCGKNVGFFSGIKVATPSGRKAYICKACVLDIQIRPSITEERNRAPRGPYLLIKRKGGETVGFELRGEEWTIGRGSHCEILIRDAALSRRHARLIRKEDDFIIEDLSSSNGTFVNTSKINEPTVIKPNDIVTVGPFAIHLRTPNI